MLVRHGLSKRQILFQHTAARRRLVSWPRRFALDSCRFNTQPPEGGWERLGIVAKDALQFQHTAARRRLGLACSNGFTYAKFQHTAARRRLAFKIRQMAARRIGFNTQPPEGGWVSHIIRAAISERFQHTAARRRLERQAACLTDQTLFQHTAARRRLGWAGKWRLKRRKFQHTAARRRLAIHYILKQCRTSVSTHSRPKAAGLRAGAAKPDSQRFNTQPPEGGWNKRR